MTELTDIVEVVISKTLPSEAWDMIADSQTRIGLMSRDVNGELLAPVPAVLVDRELLDRIIYDAELWRNQWGGIPDDKLAALKRELTK